MATKTWLKKWIHAAISSHSGQIFMELNSTGIYRSLKKEKESSCLVFKSSRKREFRQFHIVVVQWRQRKVRLVTKKCVTYLPSCCFANLNLLLQFFRSRCRRCLQPPVATREPVIDSNLRWKTRGLKEKCSAPEHVNTPKQRLYDLKITSLTSDNIELIYPTILLFWCNLDE